MRGIALVIASSGAMSLLRTALWDLTPRARRLGYTWLGMYPLLLGLVVAVAAHAAVWLR